MSTLPSHIGLVTLAFSLMLVAAAPGCSDDRPALRDGSISDVSAPADASGPMSGCPAVTGPIDPTMLIDDFEHATSAAPLIAGRAGIWWASGDPTPTAIMQPFGDAPPELLPGGRCGSLRALHVTGSGFLDWGSQVVLSLHEGQNASGVFEEQPYDARARGYQGISFLARVGSTSITTVRFAVSDEYARPEAGLCVPNGTQANNCYDTFGVPLDAVLTTDWKEIQIPFSGLAQRNFGLQGGALPDTAKLYDVGFTFPGKVIFDFWVDDIRFY